MKEIKFNDKRILKSLLDKSKTMFIEKAWEKGSPIFIHECGFDPPDCYCNRDEDNYTPFCKGFTCNPTYYAGRKIINNPCKYKVGEIYEVVWKNRNSAYKLNHPDVEESMPGVHHATCFRNPLGKVKITKIEKIEIESNRILIFDEQIHSEQLYDISKQLGDSSPEEMFKRIEEMGDLKESKPFWLISMELIK